MSENILLSGRERVEGFQHTTSSAVGLSPGVETRKAGPAGKPAMGPTLPEEADEWADRLQARVNENDRFADAAEGFEATFRFEILPDDAYDGQPVALTLVVADGACVAARGFDRDADYDFALRGPYSVWKDLLEDEIELTSAVMGGPLDLEGSTIKLMQHRDAVAELVRSARAVDTEYAH